MTANREMAALWNESSGRTWVELQGLLDTSLAPFETVLVDNAFPGESGRVLDVGCGAGATTFAMARRVGPAGRCVGADISAPLVAAAKARAAAEGVANADFVEADAQTYAFEPGAFDAVISRFGVMFFDDPPAAFANIRRGVRRDARLAFVAWRSPAENPFMTAPGRAAASLFPDMKPPDPNAPGMFAFADGEKVRGILGAAGWADIEVRAIDVPCTVPEAQLVTYGTRLGAVGMALRTTNADDATRARAAELVARGYQPFVRDGAAHFTAACWLALARSPA